MNDTQYTDIDKMWQKRSLIADHVQRDCSFQFTRVAHLLDAEFPGECHKSLNRNKAVGIDEVSWEAYGENLDENLAGLVSRKRKRNWDNFNNYLKHYPFPKPRIVHNFYLSPGWCSKPKSRMWEIHKSGSVRGIETPHSSENLE